LPDGLQTRDLFIVGVTASIGFTVSPSCDRSFPEGTRSPKQRWALF
jgi:hypothetical protein